MTTLRPVSTVEALAAALRERVLSGDIEPGAALPEQELSARYGVARPTVREALALLVHEGLLRRERNRSAYVPVITSADLADLMYVRGPLEELMAQAVAGRRVTAAEDALARLSGLPPGAPWAAVVAEHMALHEALVAAAGSPRLERLYATLAAETRLGLVGLRHAYGDPQQLAAEHAALLRVIAEGPADAAVHAVREHLRWRHP
ncbi:GntR family transcriptional regulator [Microbispora sp. CA-102843]|uniref:GntR family transcriptional regulator n=1 Tax=Microbispora sp. CA-102843 TaxID=3239952 RepID=UPI003D8E7A77